jgi:hypothetical protein
LTFDPITRQSFLDITPEALPFIVPFATKGVIDLQRIVSMPKELEGRRIGGKRFKIDTDEPDGTAMLRELGNVKNQIPIIALKKALVLGSGMVGSAMARDLRPDVFCFCTLPNLRMPMIRAGVEGGAKLIAFEKPVALNRADLHAMREAVKRAGGRVLLEASGSMTLANVREVADTGVDLISVGALTHSAAACDISMKITNKREEHRWHPSPCMRQTGGYFSLRL